MSPNRVKAAAIGGATAGVASSLPILEYVNVACCALIVGGAVLAVYLALRNEPPTEKAPLGAGAGIGALSGIFAAVVGTIVSIPLTLIRGNAGAGAIQEMLDSGAIAIEGPVRDILESMAGSGDGIAVGALLVGLVFALIIDSIFGTLGGILGAAIFNKKA